MQIMWPIISNKFIVNTVQGWGLPEPDSGTGRCSMDACRRGGAGVLHTAEIIASEGLVAHYRPLARGTSIGLSQLGSSPAAQHVVHMDGASIAPLQCTLYPVSSLSPMLVPQMVGAILVTLCASAQLFLDIGHSAKWG